MSLLQCKCAAPLWALGIPDCYPVLRPIRRVAFETRLNSDDDITSFDLLNSVVYEDARRLMTPILYSVESERPESVFEELSGQRFFVRHQPRTFRAIVPSPPTEWGINIEQLRCRSQLGVFLIDEAGVVWGRRISPTSAAPIPIQPSTIQVRMLFPSDSTIAKYEFSFEFALNMMDFELVPVFADANLLNYIPPIAAHMRARWVSSTNSLYVEVYALYARAAGDFRIPITGLASILRVRNAGGSVIPTTFTEGFPGRYEETFTTAPPPSGNPYTVDVNPIPTGTPFDLTTAIAQFNV